MNWLKKHKGAFTTAIFVHLLFAAAVLAVSLKTEVMSLESGETGSVIEVQMIEKRAEPKPQPQVEKPKASEPEVKEPPQPKPVEKKPEPVKRVEEKKVTPKPTPKPVEKKPEPPKVREIPKKEPEKKVTKKPEPKPTPRPTPVPQPRFSAEELKKMREKIRPTKELRTPAPGKPVPVSRSKPSSTQSPSTPAGPETTKRGNTSLKSIGLPSYYSNSALAKLSKYFRLDEDEQKPVSATLGCRISRSGEISRVSVVRSSGDTNLDQKAVQALEITKRFSPFPDDFKKPFVDVEIEFSFQN